MARYIDADKLIAEQTFFVKDNEGFDMSVVLVSDIKRAPTADVEEVKHGEWIYHECVCSYDGTKSGYACSECGAFVDEEIFELDEFHKEFCGNCGAKMGGKSLE